MKDSKSHFTCHVIYFFSPPFTSHMQRCICADIEEVHGFVGEGHEFESNDRGLATKIKTFFLGVGGLKKII